MLYIIRFFPLFQKFYAYTYTVYVNVHFIYYIFFVYYTFFSSLPKILCVHIYRICKRTFYILYFWHILYNTFYFVLRNIALQLSNFHASFSNMIIELDCYLSDSPNFTSIRLILHELFKFSNHLFQI